jgi:hypothetical protein
MQFKVGDLIDCKSRRQHVLGYVSEVSLDKKLVTVIFFKHGCVPLLYNYEYLDTYYETISKALQYKPEKQHEQQRTNQKIY